MRCALWFVRICLSTLITLTECYVLFFFFFEKLRTAKKDEIWTTILAPMELRMEFIEIKLPRFLALALSL